jgi:iron complex outermembrane recepter protein
LIQPTTLSRAIALAIVSGAFAAPGSFAQDAAPAQRVEITGSAIKRIDAETAVPVTVFKMDDLRKEGISTTEQLISKIGASQSTTVGSNSVGAETGGASFADLRGLGSNKTLILLDGRRIANNAIDGSAPDLNMIPFGALERVEVLRDGASALYGTDAIGGVINFITRKSIEGGSISLSYEKPQNSGGESGGLNLAFGYGSLSTNGFNLFGVIDYQKQKQITSAQREFGSTGYIPSKGLGKSSGNTFPANWFQLDDAGNFSGTQNPAAPDCNANPYLFPPSTPGGCRYDFTKWVDLIPKTERLSGFFKSDISLSENHTLGLSYFVTKGKNSTSIAPVPYGGYDVNPTLADGVTPNPFYPGNAQGPVIPAGVIIDPTQPITVSYRDVAGGPRQAESHNTQQRFVVSLDGTLADWDYKTGISFNQNKLVTKITGGYTDDNLIGEGLLNGIINPFGEQSPEGQTYIDNAAARGTLHTAKGDVWSVDGQASREIGDWFGSGKQVALAVGGEYRKEKFSDVADPFSALVFASSGFDPATDNRGDRNVYAIFSQIDMPVLSNLDLTLAVRYDKYSDFGNTTNPKVGFVFRPTKEFLLRGSYSTGFRAPSLYELNSPITYTNTGNSYNDPVLCPGGVPAPGYAAPEVCDTQFTLQAGGNPALKAETAKNTTLGMLFEPAAGTSFSLDLWWIKLKQSIAALDEELIFGDPTKYADLFKRNGTNQISTNTADCSPFDPATCGYVINTNQNLGGINTNGVDIAGSYKLKTDTTGTFNFQLNATYINKYEYQQEEGGIWLQNVGVYSGAGPIFRWQGNITATWSYDQWSIGIGNRYKSGYYDQNAAAPDFVNQVSDYSLWDLYGSWSPIKDINLTLGVRNVLDTDPPFSNQLRSFQVGYDPRFTDPAGRAYYLKATYNF